MLRTVWEKPGRLHPGRAHTASPLLAWASAAEAMRTWPRSRQPCLWPEPWACRLVFLLFSCASQDQEMPAPPPGLSPGGEPGDADASPRTLPGEGPGDAGTSPRVRGPSPSSSASPTMRLPVHPAPVAVLVPECGGRSQGQYGALRPQLGLWPSRPVDLPLHPPSGTFIPLLCSPVLLQPRVI